MNYRSDQQILLYWVQAFACYYLTANKYRKNDRIRSYQQNRIDNYQFSNSSEITDLENMKISSVQSLSRVWLFATPWTAARQASLSITNSWNSPEPMSIESVMPSNHLILCHSLLLLPSIFPSIRSFQMSQLFASGVQSIGVSASRSVLPMNTQDWSPLGWTGWISLQDNQWILKSLGLRLSTLHVRWNHLGG